MAGKGESRPGIDFSMRFRLLAGAVALLMCSACSSGPALVGRPDLSIVDGSVLPPPDVVDLISEERPYLIGPLDQVSIDVYRVPELSRAVQIDASGRIALPLIGVVQASGKTPGELGKEIADKLRERFVKDPQVTINLTSTVSQVVTIDGAVEEPGVYPISGRFTLMRAVAKAKGLTEFARTEHVVVFRTVKNRQMAALYNLQAIRNGAYSDPEVYPNDVILVGDSAARRIFRDIISTAPLLSAPIIALLN